MTFQWLRLSVGSSAAELGLYVLAVAGVLWLCWALSKYVTRKAGAVANTSNIRILERVNLAQDKGLIIAEICGSVYLLSFSNERVEILKELDASKLVKPKQLTPPDFKEILNSALKGRWNATGNDSKFKNSGK
jgi:flagellar protein FliO/FliZ